VDQGTNQTRNPDLRLGRACSRPDLSEPVERQLTLYRAQLRPHVSRRGFQGHERSALSAPGRLCDFEASTVTSRRSRGRTGRAVRRLLAGERAAGTEERLKQVVHMYDWVLREATEADSTTLVALIHAAF